MRFSHLKLLMPHRVLTRRQYLLCITALTVVCLLSLFAYRGWWLSSSHSQAERCASLSRAIDRSQLPTETASERQARRLFRCAQSRWIAVRLTGGIGNQLCALSLFTLHSGDTPQFVLYITFAALCCLKVGSIYREPRHPPHDPNGFSFLGGRDRVTCYCLHRFPYLFWAKLAIFSDLCCFLSQTTHFWKKIFEAIAGRLGGLCVKKEYCNFMLPSSTHAWRAGLIQCVIPFFQQNVIDCQKLTLYMHYIYMHVDLSSHLRSVCRWRREGVWRSWRRARTRMRTSCCERSRGFERSPTLFFPSLRCLSTSSKSTRIALSVFSFIFFFTYSSFFNFLFHSSIFIHFINFGRSDSNLRPANKLSFDILSSIENNFLIQELEAFQFI